uniref:Uncharacterized protein n=1 Tax=Oryza punctata TaxID=4537 RepID=A0A0E0JJ77_ORYPU
MRATAAAHKSRDLPPIIFSSPVSSTPPPISTTRTPSPASGLLPAFSTLPSPPRGPTPPPFSSCQQSRRPWLIASAQPQISLPPPQQHMQAVDDAAAQNLAVLVVGSGCGGAEGWKTGLTMLTPCGASSSPATEPPSMALLRHLTPVLHKPVSGAPDAVVKYSNSSAPNAAGFALRWCAQCQCLYAPTLGERLALLRRDGVGTAKEAELGQL